MSDDFNSTDSMETSFSPELAPVLTDPDVVNLAPFPFAITDIETGSFLYANERVRKLFGLPSDGPSDLNISYLYSSLETRAQLVEIILTRGVVNNVEVPVKRSDGTIIHVLGSARLVKFKDRLCALVAVADVTIMKQLMNDLEQTRQELQRNLEVTERLQAAAEQESKIKSNLLINLSHEIRTPLNGIIGMSQVLADEDIGSELRTYVEAIQTSALALDSVTTAILEHNELTSGSTEANKLPVDPSEVVAGAIRYIETRIGAKPIEVAVFIDPNMPSKVEIDADKLLQALTHLLNNSVKFTEAGSITIECGFALDQLTINISDTGIGIPADSYDSIFNDFLQLDDSATRKFGGIGLGLSIAKKAVGCMGGQILVSSEEGKGSTFTLIIPAAAAQEASCHHLAPARRHAALYSNSAPLAQMATSVLRQTGYEAETHPLECWDGSVRLSDDLVILDFPNSLDVTIATINRLEPLPHILKQNLVCLVHRNCAPPPAMIEALAPTRFVVKPTAPETLRNAICQHEAGNLYLPHRSPEGVAADQKSTSIVYLPLVLAIDRNWTNVDGHFMRRIVSLLNETCNQCIEGIKLGIERKDSSLVYAHAYNLHGSTLNAGAASAAQHCRRILEAALQQDFQEIDKALPLVLADLERFEEVIDRELGRKEA